MSPDTHSLQEWVSGDTLIPLVTPSRCHLTPIRFQQVFAVQLRAGGKMVDWGIPKARGTAWWGEGPPRMPTVDEAGGAPDGPAENASEIGDHDFEDAMSAVGA